MLGPTAAKPSTPAFACSSSPRSAQHGMIAFTGLRAMENKDWLMQLPFLIINSGMAGLLGAAFNSFRMWLWKVRRELLAAGRGRGRTAGGTGGEVEGRRAAWDMADVPGMSKGFSHSKHTQLAHRLAGTTTSKLSKREL